jgi:hypothetical protein
MAQQAAEAMGKNAELIALPPPILLPPEPKIIERIVKDPDTEFQLQNALNLIEESKRKLIEEKSIHKKKMQAWHLENAQLRVEKEMLRVSARAGDAMINNLATAVKARKDGNASSDESKFLNDLLTKNDRLEKQMSEMKDTWAAYLDLILENQKNNGKASPRGSVIVKPGENKSKIVRPVRKQSFFSSLFGKPSPGGPAVTNSPVITPEVTSPIDRRTPSASLSNASSSFVTPVTTRTISTSAPTAPFSPTIVPTSTISPSSRSTYDQVLRKGYLYKKPIGYSTPSSRNWRKRLFLLRPHCIDYYDINQNNELSSENLVSSLRGTIPLDQTSIVKISEIKDETPFGFDIVTRNKEHRLYALAENELNEWITDITSTIDKIKNDIGETNEKITLLNTSSPTLKSSSIESLRSNSTISEESDSFTAGYSRPTMSFDDATTE